MTTFSPSATLARWGVLRGKDEGGVTLAVAFTTAFLWALLLIRPLLDTYANDRFSIAGVSINAAAVFGILVVIVLFGAVLHDRAVLRTPVSGALLAVLAASAFAAAVALLELTSRIDQEPVQELVRLGAIFAVFLLAARYVREAASVRRLFVVAGLSALVPALVGIYQLVTGTSPDSVGLTISRITSTFTGPNACGEYLALAALILIAIPAPDLRLRLRLGALIPILVALVATYSRTGLAVFVIGLVVLEFPRRKSVVLAMAAVAVAVAVAVPTVRERVTSAGATLTGGEASKGVDANSFQWRLDTWELYWEKYQTRPITGFGLQSSEVVSPRKLKLPGSPAAAYTAHNSALKLLFEGGIILFAAWVVLVFVIVRKLYRLAREHWPLSWHAHILLVLWGLVILEGLAADDPLRATAEMYMLFALTGATFGASLASGTDTTPGFREGLSQRLRALGSRWRRSGNGDRRSAGEPTERAAAFDGITEKKSGDTGSSRTTITGH